jgi:Glycosyl hydrolase catalytic core
VAYQPYCGFHHINKSSSYISKVFSLLYPSFKYQHLYIPPRVTHRLDGSTLLNFIRSFEYLLNMPSFSTLTVALVLPLLALSSPLYTNHSSSASANAPFPKRGLAYNDPKYIQNWNGGGSQVNWGWNWDSAMDGNFPKWAEYIPMLWGTADDHTSQVRSPPRSVFCVVP